MTRVSTQTTQTRQTGQSAQTAQPHDAHTAAELRRFQAWLAERRTSTAPVTSWPPDEADYFGGRVPPPPRKRGRRRKV